MSKKTLEKKVTDELVRTGFPTEIVTSSVMQSRGWYVLNNPSYLDDSEQVSREFDIRAYCDKDFSVNSKDFSVGIYLMTECKKSEKPWMFFTTPENHKDARLGRFIKWNYGQGKVFTDNLNSESIITDKKLRRFHHYFRQSRLARTFHEPLKGNEKKGRSQMIYSAIMSAIKATLFIREEFPVENWLRLFYPVIVFNGNLFEARVDNDKNIELLSTKFVQLSFNYIVPNKIDAQRSPIYRFDQENHHEFIVDIVHEDYLKDYLKIIEVEHTEIMKHFREFLKREKS